MVNEHVNSKANLAGKNKRMKKVKKIDNIDNIDVNYATTFTSHSFYTIQAGVFMTRIDKSLGATPSDKVVSLELTLGLTQLEVDFAKLFVNLIRHVLTMNYLQTNNLRH